MATITPSSPPTAAPPRRRREVGGRPLYPTTLFTIFTALWIAFFVALVVDPGFLDTVWQQFTSLHVALQVIGWILFLPIALGLWVWETDLALWLRLALVIVIAIGWTGAMAPRRG